VGAEKNTQRHKVDNVSAKVRGKSAKVKAKPLRERVGMVKMFTGATPDSRERPKN